MRPTLLLADDSVTIQRVIELTFADEDLDVVTAGDGDEAITLINAKPPDIVLVDVGMPGRNGYDVARYVKRSPLLSHIPVVLLVGAFEPIDQRRAEEAWCDGVFAKPFEPKLVIGKVRELLGRGKGRSLGARTGSPASVLDLRPTEAPERAAGSGEAAGGGNIDEYFDRLGHAFSQLSTAQTGRSRPARDLPSTSVPGGPQSSNGERPGAPPFQAARDERGATTPARDREATPARDRADTDRAINAPSRPITLPSLPEAFAALLSAERTAGRPQFGPQWPATTGSGQASFAEVSDDLVEKAAKRVVEQIAEQGVRETVTDIVSSVAERLVREEIARLKSSVS